MNETSHIIPKNTNPSNLNHMMERSPQVSESSNEKRSHNDQNIREYPARDCFHVIPAVAPETINTWYDVEK